MVMIYNQKKSVVSKSPFLRRFLVSNLKILPFLWNFTVFVKLLHSFYWFHNFFSLFFCVKTRVFGLFLGRSEVSLYQTIKPFHFLEAKKSEIRKSLRQFRAVFTWKLYHNKNKKYMRFRLKPHFLHKTRHKFSYSHWFHLAFLVQFK